MLPLPAQLTTDVQASDDRGAVRRSLSLEVPARSPGNAAGALIRNLSEQGLLIDTAADLAVGESIHVDLPEAGPCEARVIWRDGSLYGCQFLRPVPKAAVSAALLLAPVERLPAIAHPDRAASPPLVEDRARPEPVHRAPSPDLDLILIASLVIGSIMAALFIFALLTFPFST